MQNFIAHYAPIFAPFARTLTITSIVLIGLLLLWLIAAMPLRLRLAGIKLEPLIKLLSALVVGTWCTAAIVVMITYPFLIAAKLWIINLLVLGIAGCWFLIATSKTWSRLLTDIQQECELANNLVFLQGEMARAQLETLAAKIRASAEPQERELTETMLKTLSPVVMLFLNKERSVMKWSLAAANVGKSLMSYFWSAKK